MKKLLLCILTVCAFNYLVTAQTSKEIKAGHIFYITLPDFLSKTSGINSSATIQFHNKVKAVWGFVIEDTKEDLGLLEMKYANAKEFYDDFIKDFIKDEEKRTIATEVASKVGDKNYVETEASYYDKEEKVEIYYFITIVETKNTFYKMICSCPIDDKAKYKSIFQKIAKSIRD